MNKFIILPINSVSDREKNLDKPARMTKFEYFGQSTKVNYIFKSSETLIPLNLLIHRGLHPIFMFRKYLKIENRQKKFPHSQKMREKFQIYNVINA